VANFPDGVMDLSAVVPVDLGSVDGVALLREELPDTADHRDFGIHHATLVTSSWRLRPGRSPIRGSPPMRTANSIAYRPFSAVRPKWMLAGREA
jgi:hypothetical protein